MRLADSLTARFLAHEIISSDEKEIVKFGLENIGSTLLGLAIILAIGSYFDYLLGSFVLWLLQFPLRKNAGGFHAKTKAGCLLTSAVIFYVCAIIYLRLELSSQLYLLIMAILFCIIFLMAPVDSENKRLDKMEYEVYRRRTRFVLIAEGGLFILAFIMDWKMLMRAVAMVYSIVGVLLLSGQLKNWINNRDSRLI